MAPTETGAAPLPFTRRAHTFHFARRAAAILALGALPVLVAGRGGARALGTARPGRTLTFVPTPLPGKTQRSVTAQVVGADIYLDKTVFVGERPFRVRLLFRRDPSLW